MRILLLLALVPLFSLGAVCPFEKHPTVAVRLDPDATFQTMEGIGGSAADEAALRAMPEPDRTQVLDLVFGDLEPSVVRLKVRPAIEPVNDDADPSTVNAAGFVRPGDLLWQHEEIFARGDPFLIAALWTPPAWMKNTNQECCGGTLLPNHEPELAELFSVWLDFVAGTGHPVHSLSIQNEPEAASPWDANNYNPTRMDDVAEAVAQRLLADGHATTLHGPDNAVANFVPLYLPPILARPTASSIFQAVGFHLYGATTYFDSSTVAPDVEPVLGVAPPGLPLWMTEFSNTPFLGYGTWDEGIWQAELLHESFQSGVSLYAMWNLYRPGGPGEAAIVIPTRHGDPGYTITPKYWTLRQYAKYVRPGAVRIGSDSPDADVLVSAFRDDANAKLVAVAINRHDTPRWVLFEGAETTRAPQVVRSAPAETGVEIALDSADRIGDRSVLLPGRSVTTLVWPIE